MFLVVIVITIRLYIVLAVSQLNSIKLDGHYIRPTVLYITVGLQFLL